MSLICKFCGAPASNSSNLLSFICGYCGSKNVDPDYLKQYASRLDLAKANHNFQLAMVSINGGDYANAEKHLEASVLGDANNSESWVYLALSRAALIKPSNYSRLFESSIQCLNKAKLIDPDSEVYSNGSLLVQAKLLEASIVGAGYYIETAYKKYTAYSGTSGATLSAAEEAQKGLRLIDNAHKLSINNNELSVKALVYAIANCIMFKKEVGATGLIDDQYKSFLRDLNAIYQKRKDLVLGELASYPNQKVDIQKALEKLNPITKRVVTAEGSSSKKITNSSGAAVNRDLLVVLAGLVIVIVSYFAFGWRKESDSIATTTLQQSSPSASISAPSTPSPTKPTVAASAASSQAPTTPPKIVNISSGSKSFSGAVLGESIKLHRYGEALEIDGGPYFFTKNHSRLSYAGGRSDSLESPIVNIAFMCNENVFGKSEGAAVIDGVSCESNVNDVLNSKDWQRLCYLYSFEPLDKPLSLHLRKNNAYIDIKYDNGSDAKIAEIGITLIKVTLGEAYQDCKEAEKMKALAFQKGFKSLGDMMIKNN